MKPTHAQRLEKYRAAYVAAQGQPPHHLTYEGGYYRVNSGSYRAAQIDEMTARLEFLASPAGVLKRALEQSGFRLHGDSYQRKESGATAIATDRTGLKQPTPDDWALVVRRDGCDDDADTDIQHDDDDAPPLAEAIQLCAARAVEIANAKALRDAAEKLAAEYDSECNPNRADELRRAFAELPEASAAKLYAIIARNF